MARKKDLQKGKKKRISFTQLMLITFSAFILASFAVVFSIQQVSAAAISGFSISGFASGEYTTTNNNGSCSYNNGVITVSAKTTSSSGCSGTTYNVIPLDGIPIIPNLELYNLIRTTTIHLM